MRNRGRVAAIVTLLAASATGAAVSAALAQDQAAPEPPWPYTIGKAAWAKGQAGYLHLVLAMEERLAEAERDPRVGAPASQASTDARTSAAGDPFCGAEAARIMILGTFHFSNPGLDAYNLDADDVLAPRRQREIQEVVDRLAAFRPTKVMVEAPYRHRTTMSNYAKYVAGDYELGRSETEQIGFRLAHRLGHPSVIPVDFEMRMSGLRPDELDHQWRPPTPSAPAAPAPETSQAEDEKAAELAEEQRLLLQLSLREFLVRANDPDPAEADHSAAYMPLLLPGNSTPALYEQSDYLVNWYKRNIRIFANIIRETAFPDDRVLLIIGRGHLKILSDLAHDAGYFCLVDVNSYLR